MITYVFLEAIIPKQITVYLIKFNNTVKYVGITSGSLSKRKREHFSMAYSQDSHYLIHRAIRKYEDIEFIEFLSCRDWNTACDIEKELIKKFKTYVKSGGYNLTLGGEGCPQAERSKEWRRKKSLSQKAKKPFFLGKKHTAESKRRMSEKRKGVSAEHLKKPIIDNFGNEYDSATDASRILGIKRKTIQESMKRNGTLRNGLKFSYVEVDHP